MHEGRNEFIISGTVLKKTNKKKKHLTVSLKQAKLTHP